MLKLSTKCQISVRNGESPHLMHKIREE
jgi:hypothetical protein